MDATLDRGLHAFFADGSYIMKNGERINQVVNTTHDM